MTRRIVLIAGSLVLVAVVAGVAANAFGRGHWGHRGHDPEAMKEHLALGVEHALRRVDASEEQKLRGVEIAEATFDELAPMFASHRESRERLLELLSAESVDREALEALRAESFARFELASRALLGGLADLAETLTPEQREELLEHGHHGRRGWH
jgi:Spy/CpxP family protein refolding chaperone